MFCSRQPAGSSLSTPSITRARRLGRVESDPRQRAETAVPSQLSLRSGTRRAENRCRDRLPGRCSRNDCRRGREEAHHSRGARGDRRCPPRAGTILPRSSSQATAGTGRRRGRSRCCSPPADVVDDGVAASGWHAGCVVQQPSAERGRCTVATHGLVRRRTRGDRRCAAFVRGTRNGDAPPVIDEFNGSGFAATDLRGRAPAFSLIARLRQEMSGTGGNPQAGIPSHARSWFVGILGELEIAGLLDALPSGWLVLHSVPLGESGTDIDHVVVSPRGVVMTINTKRHAGKRIWVGEHAL
ncbi:hypothetical protein DEJ30_08470 [Curtobacterium sp. MCPF17_003]|nr:hypothetical protein DEJ30_08470 [Curtobacterium sp. MCPF17_003]